MKKIILFFIVVLLIATACQSLNEKALLTLVINNYYINENNRDEGFFVFSIINYGYEEAKNVEIRCILYDESENVIISVIEEIGNIASTSVEYQELVIAVPNVPEETLLGPACFITGCDNCEILSNRIPEYNKLIESYQ